MERWLQNCEDPKYIAKMALAFRLNKDADWWVDYTNRLIDLATRYHDAAMGSGPFSTMDPDKREAARVAHNVLLQVLAIPIQVQTMAERREMLEKETALKEPEFPGLW